MGNALYRKLFGRQEVRILILGLDAAGKTTALYRLKLGEVVTTIPTIGFNVETVAHKNVNITAWDVGGRDKIRPLYRHYYANTDGLVFVVDSNDKDRFDDAIDEINRGINSEDELRGIPVLVLANKQDIPGAIKPEDIAKRIMDAKLLRNHIWTVFGVTATSGDGLFEALTWLTDCITANKKKVLYNKMANDMSVDSKVNGGDKSDPNNNSDSPNKGLPKVTYLTDIALTLKHLIVGK